MKTYTQLMEELEVFKAKRDGSHRDTIHNKLVNSGYKRIPPSNPDIVQYKHPNGDVKEVRHFKDRSYVE